MSNNKYEKAKVYKIWSIQGDKIYVGSTCKEYLSQRMVSHRKDYKQWKQCKNRLISSYLIFDEYGLENCFIELIEAKACNSKDELHQLEGKYIRELICVNKCIAVRTEKQYREDNKENKKKYLEENKDKLILQHKQYYENNKEKMKKKNLGLG